MLTACHSCDHAAACRNCPDIGTAHCLKCQHGNRNKEMPGPFCWTCKRGTEHDDIRIRHSAHNRDHLTPQTIQYTPNGKLANFDTDDEDALRALIYTVTALDPLQFVVALHVARRGTARTVAEAVADFAATVRSYKTHKGRIGKATSAAKFASISKKLKVVAAVRVWAKGRAGPGRKAKGKDE